MRLCSAILLAVASCASVRQDQQPKEGVIMASQFKARDGTAAGVGGAGPKGKFRCEMETTVGTHIPDQVCRYQDDTVDSVQSRERTRQELINLPQPATRTPNGGG